MESFQWFQSKVNKIKVLILELCFCVNLHAFGIQASKGHTGRKNSVNGLSHIYFGTGYRTFDQFMLHKITWCIVNLIQFALNGCYWLSLVSIIMMNGAIVWPKTIYDQTIKSPHNSYSEPEQPLNHFSFINIK